MPAAADRAAFVQQEFRSAVWQSSQVKNDWYGKVARDTKDSPFVSFFSVTTDAKRYIDERGGLLGGHARLFRVVVDGVLTLDDIDLSQSVPGARLIDDDLVCDFIAGVVAIESVDLENERTTLKLWGIVGEVPAQDADVAAGAGSASGTGAGSVGGGSSGGVAAGAGTATGTGSGSATGAGSSSGSGSGAGAVSGAGGEIAGGAGAAAGAGSDTADGSTGSAGITVRGTSKVMNNATTASLVVPIPATAVAGDRAVLHAEHAYSMSNPTGWTQLENLTGINVNGYCGHKVLTSGDITAGSVTINASGSYYGGAAMTVFVGAPSIRTHNGNRMMGTPNTLSTDSTPQSGDYAVYFGSSRTNGTASCNVGSALQSGTSADAAIVLTGALLAASGAVSATFTYSGATSGDYQSIVVLQP
jgi:hypothetical protein